MTHGHPAQHRCRWCGQRIAEAEPPNTITPGPHRWFHVADRAYQCARWDGQHMAEPIPELHERVLLQQVKEFVGHHQHLRRSLREAHQARASATRRLHDYQALVDAMAEAQQTDGENSFRFGAAVAALIAYRRGS